MRYQSRRVDSDQAAVHPRLITVLARHLCTRYEKPVADASRALFTRINDIYWQSDRPVILDAGCGTGASTRQIAGQNPDALVIGVDKSAHRLARAGLNTDMQQHGNCMLVRMDLVDFWRLALGERWRLRKHYLLYPNPWPKAKHLQRRWHAHPVFPALLGLGGQLELRCNWQLYAEEFKAALDFILPGTCRLAEYAPGAGISPFELKYAGSGHRLFHCVARLDQVVTGNQSAGELQPILAATCRGEVRTIAGKQA